MRTLFFIIVLIISPSLADDKTIAESCDFRAFTKAGSVGPYKNVILLHCLWPRLDQPTALFAEGSSGLKVMGPPTPRNVIFPPDTEAIGRTNLSVFFLRNGDTISDISDADIRAATTGAVIDRKNHTFRPISDSSPKDTPK